MQSPFFVSLIQAEAKKKGVGEKLIRWILRDGNREDGSVFLFSGVAVLFLIWIFLSKGLDKLLQLYILYIYS